MKIGVLGAGAIGTYLGGKLIAAGHDVVLVGRLGAEIAAHGIEALRITRARTLNGSNPRASATSKASKPRRWPTATRSSRSNRWPPKTPRVLLRGFCCGRSPGSAFQNGVSNVPRLRALLPGHTVLKACVVPFSTSPGSPLLPQHAVSTTEPTARWSSKHTTASKPRSPPLFAMPASTSRCAMTSKGCSGASCSST